ncbi:MAG: hypothetical protein HWD59_14200 [Coxiellaceae bacterium]|nr:MAG: hypothetical protein HWD59_14200 [Coxiellaceae bacterium]
MRPLLFGLMFICCCLLSACGFKLRGDADIPPAVRVLYIKSNNPYGEFESTLRSTLPPMGIRLVDNPTEAAITLEILKTDLNYFITSISASNQASTYQVTYSARIAAKDNKGKTILAPETISSSETLMVNANTVIGSNNQLDLLSKQLQQDLVFKILNLLSAPRVKEALAQTHGHD